MPFLERLFIIGFALWKFIFRQVSEGIGVVGTCFMHPFQQVVDQTFILGSVAG